MTTKEKQRELIVEIMKEDEKSGLYEEPVRKNTAVDLLFLALWTAPKDKFRWHSILKQAKELEKQQIKEAYQVIDLDIQHEDVGEINSEEYYNETYK
jgi:hypothetical protein